jgi:plastocyanin
MKAETQSVTANTRPSRLPLAALGKLTVAALVGNVLADVGEFVLLHRVIPPLLGFAAGLLIVAGIVAMGWRWAPALGAVMGSAVVYGIVRFNLAYLTHPNVFGFFAVFAVMLAVAIAEIGAGIGATVQNYRGSERRAPRGLRTALVGFSSFVLGAILVAGIIAATAPANSTVVRTAGEPVVHMGASNFAQSSVVVPKGSQLLLVDDGPFLHILANGTWENGTARPGTEPGAPRVDNLQLNGNSVAIGPFTTAGTYHIYCTIHPGMDLTVTVR